MGRRGGRREKDRVDCGRKHRVSRNKKKVGKKGGGKNWLERNGVDKRDTKLGKNTEVGRKERLRGKKEGGENEGLGTNDKMKRELLKLPRESETHHRPPQFAMVAHQTGVTKTGGRERGSLRFLRETTSCLTRNHDEFGTICGL